MPLTDRVSRSPHGERGLKSNACWKQARQGRSLSSWRAWIEIEKVNNESQPTKSLSSWRAWIEMKGQIHKTSWDESLSSWRAWIEISACQFDALWVFRSLSSWRAWIEIDTRPCHHGAPMSLSSWRAWIEIVNSRTRATPSVRRSPHGERGLK